MAAFAGLREGQICLRRPADVDLVGNWITVRPAPGAKTKRAVRVPIHPRLRGSLEALPRRPRPWLFTAAPSPKYPAGDHGVPPKRSYDLRTVLKALGLPVGQKDGGYTFRSFRRFFRTHTTNAGVPREVVDAWMGHTSDRSMATVYYQLSDAVPQSAMPRVPFGAGESAADREKEG